MEFLGTYKRDLFASPLRVKLLDSGYTDGRGLGFLSYNSSGLNISVIASDAAIPTSYLQASGNIETISNLGIWVQPTTNKCRFKEVNRPSMPGLYELQFTEGILATESSKSVCISVNGVTGLVEAQFLLMLADYVEKDSYDILNNSTYGLAKLVRASYPASTLYTYGGGVKLYRPSGIVVNDASNTISYFKTNQVETTEGYWIGSYLKFTNGSMINQVRKIVAYDATGKFITVASGFTAVPSTSTSYTYDILSE